MVRPFTLNRLADLVHLTRTSRTIASEDVEQAMMVTKERALELIKQAEEMSLIKKDGNLYRSTNLGNEFFEALKNADNLKLDEILSEYKSYLKIKTILMEKSASIAELKKETGLTEVGTEIILRLIRYVREDLCIINEKYFFRNKELPDQRLFFSSIRTNYDELRKDVQWGCPKFVIRVDKIASQVCSELRLSLDDFAKLLNKAIETTTIIELHSEGTSHHFIPFSPKKINPNSYRKCYMRIQGE